MEMLMELVVEYGVDEEVGQMDRCGDDVTDGGDRNEG